jgi:acid phosphatase family membrane protein YuiD
LKAFEIAALTAIAVQLYKGLLAWAQTGHPNFRRFVETGGMPSSHAAGVCALTTSVGIREGVTTPLFGVSLYFSLIVLYDAAGLRRAAGRQAMILNRLIQQHWEHADADAHRLMELLGHTPLEVLVGALLGIASAFLWNWIL